MRIYHSMWTKPMIDNKNKIITNIWLNALSVHYINKLGFTSVLYTDNIGKELFGFLPYDEIHLTLNDIKDDVIYFWAQGKMYAHLKEELGSIHIDGDVFLKDKKLLKLLKFNNFDIIAQNYWSSEDLDTLDSSNIIKSIIDKQFKNELFNNNGLTIHCGLIGFNNQKLKDEYINGYFKFKDKLLKNKEIISELEINSFCPEYVLEEVWLQTICHTNDFKVKTILPIDDYSEYAKKIGYTHVIGKSKYNNDIIKQVKERLLEQNEDLYNLVKYTINKI